MTAGKFAFKNRTKNTALGVAALAGMTLAAGTAFADDPTTMAPPIDGASAPLSAGNAGVNASADSVFNWQEIPANQQVPLSRATFDQGGYQLYDTVGETIVVPFTNQNLYVMKFAESPNGKLYFENEGGFPVLYVPKGGYLENATVAGARWFPLGENFHPAEPVFLGIAPSYTDFVDLGWYPDTFFYGGYYGHSSFIEGGVFLPTVGLFFSIGGHPYYGWNSYHDYYREHPGFSHIGYYNRDFYHFAGNHYQAFAPNRHFGGYAGGFNHGVGGYSHGASGYNHGFGGGSHTYVARNGFGGQGGFGGARTFRGASNGNGGHSYSVSHNSYTVNNYGGGQHGGSQNGGSQSGRTFRGASNYGGGQSYSGGRSYSTGSSSYSGHSYSGGSSGSSTGRTYSGGSGGRSFGGGQQSHAVSNSGGGRSSGGGGGRGGDSGGSRDGGGGGRR